MIQEFENFLTEEECMQVIGIGESRYLNLAKTAGGSVGYRKARMAWLDIDHPLINRIREEVSRLSELPTENQETFHFIRYGIGGEYKPHLDEYNRQKTALIYLNEGFVGGETFFPKINRVIKPKTGKLVIWENQDKTGEVIQDSLHSGLPIEFGTKYISVIWIRKEKFIMK